MTQSQNLVHTIHDVVRDVTTAIERVHVAIADLPYATLPTAAAEDDLVASIRKTQRESIGAVYSLVRTVNDRVCDVIAG
jgi:hypothetical protein